VTIVALWLVALGTADLVASFDGLPTSVPRKILGLALGSATFAVGIAFSGYDGAVTASAAVCVLAALAGWLLPRSSNWSPARALIAFVTLTAGTIGAVVVGGLAKRSHHAHLDTWLRHLDYAFARDDPAKSLFVLGSLLALLATANAVVRVVLRLAKDDLSPDTQPLKGGRIIGPMERLLIFSLAISGQPTAAALAISAKSLLRFPELTAGANRDTVDSTTEYFLVGSFTSWLFALGLVALVGLLE
jgi:hypothetical protein